MVSTIFFSYRLSNSITLIFILFGFFKVSVMTEISCETVHTYDWWFGTNIKTCKMEKTTATNSTGVKLTNKDEKITGLRFYRNRKIVFLPENVNEIYPNLLFYFSNSCSIKLVSKIYFREMRKLRGLTLSYNKIEKIPTDTFEDMTSLEKLELRKIFGLYSLCSLNYFELIKFYSYFYF